MSEEDYNGIPANLDEFKSRCLKESNQGAGAQLD